MKWLYCCRVFILLLTALLNYQLAGAVEQPCSGAHDSPFPYGQSKGNLTRPIEINDFGKFSARIIATELNISGPKPSDPPIVELKGGQLRILSMDPLNSEAHGHLQAETSAPSRALWALTKIEPGTIVIQGGEYESVPTQSEKPNRPIEIRLITQGNVLFASVKTPNIKFEKLEVAKVRFDVYLPQFGAQYFLAGYKESFSGPPESKVTVGWIDPSYVHINFTETNIFSLMKELKERRFDSLGFSSIFLNQ